MIKLTRRSFLRRLGAVGAASALSGLDTLLFSGALTHAAGEDYRALVCVFLSGGNDGNSTIIPVSGDGYAAYSSVRRTLAISEQDLVPLTPPAGTAVYGLHPQLAPLRDIWDSGAMAVLLNVGALAEPTTKTAYITGQAIAPDGLFSHADQQTLWQGTGSNSNLHSGWGGRIADRLININGPTPVPMVISVAGDSLYVTGNVTRALAIPPTGGLNLYGNSIGESVARSTALDQLLAINSEALLVKEAGSVMARAIASNDIINPIITSNTSTIQNLFAGQDSGIAMQLLQVAKLIEMRANLSAKRQIFFVSLNGFDTHVNQSIAQSNLFAQLAPALKAFYEATAQLGVASNVATFTLSDFGRALQPNTSGGTDHGWGSHHFIIGGAVRGGQFYGRYPDLTVGGPDDVGREGRWIPTTAVDQYAATLATWFGITPSDLRLVVPNIGRFATANLGFLA